MEFKTPGASANPYLVMSAVLAAGMDGLRQKQLVPEEGFYEDLPKDLTEAISALEKDDVIKSGLGHDFVDLYVALKTQKEIPIIGHDEQWKTYSQLI
ncbi:lengsin-like [Symsagittifera roscoffensis]|uniref:lengsin-like n=1 Tax=Symsagittifera roscoffensis TaxID=84072 RepID=UPI00307C99DE